MKHIVLFGGTGFIGKHLITELKSHYRITVITRSTSKAPEGTQGKKLDFNDIPSMALLFDEADAIINLAGEGVGEKWTKKKKDAIKSSRLNVDHFIIEAFNACSKKPSVVIQGSGIGVYGFETSDNYFTEESALGTSGFLTEVGIAHEEALRPLQDKTRLVYIRTGIVLDGKEGALPPMAMPFKFFAGGPLGSGNQWLSWIHIKDEVRAIRYLLEKQTATGVFNLTAPNPVRQKYFAKQLGSILHRPAFMPSPGFFLKMAMGEMADELLLNGLKVTPQRLLDSDFQFKYFHIEDALKDIYQA